MKYYKEKRNGLIYCGMLNFDLYQCFIQHDQKNKRVFTIKINGNDRSFWFKAENATEAVRWVATI